MVKVSIIIPLYNAEKYLSRCLDSLVKQSLTDIEIVLVNDGSEDSSLEIVHEYSRKDNRIVLINGEENRGAMMARETGYNNATGDYIFFCDSDDIVPTNALELLYNKILLDKSDIIIGDYCYRDITGYETYVNRSENIGKYPIEMQNSILRGCKCTLWGILFSRNIFINNKLENYADQILSEDRMLLMQILNKIDTISTISTCVYIYCQNIGSSTQRTPTIKIQRSQLFALEWIWRYANKNNLNIFLTKRYIMESLGYLLEKGYDYRLLSNYNKDFYKWLKLSNLLKYFSIIKAIHIKACTNRIYAFIMYKIRKKIRKFQHKF